MTDPQPAVPLSPPAPSAGPSAPHDAATHHAPPEPAHRGGGGAGPLRRLGGFIWWLLTGFGLLGHLTGRSSKYHMGVVVVYSVHRSFFLWLLILMGFIGSVWVHHRPQSNVVWGWVYALVLLYTFFTLLFDLTLLRLMLWLGIFAFLWLILAYLEGLKHVLILQHLRADLLNMRPALDPGFATLVSWVLLIPWIGAMFHSFSRGRKVFTPNSIEEWYLGEGREVTDRSGLKFHMRYRDLFETILGLGAGDLEAVDSNHVVVKRWENVLFLAFIWRRLDEILQQRAALVDNPIQEPVEVENVHR